MITVREIDHVVYRVHDVERTLAWYCGELGLEGVRVDEWRRGEAPFPSVRVNPGSIIDLIPGDPNDANVDHICFVVDADALAEITAPRFTVVEGPVARFGARGMATSMYVRDPDGNLVELRAYPAASA
jgi:catechol 2,3-dioxygenase-like lactoylglutathione lyase family enzyme